NPGFETNTSGWAGFSTSAVTRTTSVFHSGAAGASLTPSGGKGYIGLDATSLALTVGQQYTGTFWVRVPTAGTYTGAISTGHGTDWGTQTTVAIAANTWTKFTSTMPLAHSNWWGVAFRLDKASPGTYATSEIVYFDDL